jgi:hypothetical protein
MDIMGRVRLADGRELSVVTGIDDHSRLCVCAHLVWKATARPVCNALVASMRVSGIPDSVLTDIHYEWGHGIPLSSGRRHEAFGDRRPSVTAADRLKPSGLLAC